MSRKHYPIVLSWELATTREYIGMVGMKCDTCDHRLRRNEKFWRRETQVSWFRGEDEVEIMCMGCKAKTKKETET